MKVARDNRFDIKLMSGVWIAGNKARFGAENEAEIARCVALYARYGAPNGRRCLVEDPEQAVTPPRGFAGARAMVRRGCEGTAADVD